MEIKIKIELLNFIDDKSRTLLYQTIEKAEFLINSGFFKRSVLIARFPAESISSSQCYEKLLNGGLEAKMRVKTVGNHNRPITVDDDGTLNWYSETANNMSPEKLAGILLHEFSHNKGFNHTSLGVGSYGLWLQENVPQLIKDYSKRFKRELFWFWVETALIHISRFSLSLFGFPLLPFAVLLKYGLKVKGLWLLNDTPDGDFAGGQDWWKHYNKPKWIRFILWWFRNHSWNYLMHFKPDWRGGETAEFVTIEDTTSTDKRWIWCSRAGIHGKNYIAYRVYEDGRLFARYSKASYDREIQAGCGGNRYKLKKKPLFF